MTETKKDTITKNILKIFIAAAFVCICTFAASVITAEATVTVAPTGDKSGKEDLINITAALEDDGSVVLQNGGVYYIKGTLYVKSNQSITATGATVITENGAIRNIPTAVNYNSISNFTLDGGTWKNSSSEGFKKTMMQFSHSKNITIKNATVECNYEGHALEILACKNVTVEKCKLLGVGKVVKNSCEEQLQIDIATPKTAPTLVEYGSKFVSGQTCKNITIKNNTIRGSRGICANYASTENKYINKFHKNIKIIGNKVTSKTSEAVALFNVIGATVKNNKLTNKSSRVNTAYSVGLHITMFAKAPSSIKKAKYTVTGNTIKGGRQGFFVYSHSSSKFGKVIAKNNKCYSKMGASSALVIHKDSSVKKSTSKNKTYKW